MDRGLEDNGCFLIGKQAGISAVRRNKTVVPGAALLIGVKAYALRDRVAR